jgi:hypothetical protein
MNALASLAANIIPQVEAIFRFFIVPSSAAGIAPPWDIRASETVTMNSVAVKPAIAIVISPSIFHG